MFTKSIAEAPTMVDEAYSQFALSYTQRCESFQFWFIQKGFRQLIVREAHPILAGHPLEF